MSGVHFEIGGIIVETKKAVLKKVSGTFFSGQHSYESRKTTCSSSLIVIENSDGLGFFPLIFDYIQRKYDHERDHHNQDNENAPAVIPYTSHLCPAQLQDFQLVFDFCLPGMFHNENTIMMEDTNKMPLLGLDAVQENNMAAVLAKRSCLLTQTTNNRRLLAHAS